MKTTDVPHKPPPPPKWLLRIAAVLLAVAAVLMVLQGGERTDPALFEDMNRLRTLGDLIVREVELEGRVPVQDGALDVYGVVLRFGAPEDQIVDWLHSDRRNMGPTLEEVRAGSYAHFPWMRLRLLDRLPEDRGVALLWEPAPDANGRLLVDHQRAARADHRERGRAQRPDGTLTPFSPRRAPRRARCGRASRRWRAPAGA